MITTTIHVKYSCDLCGLHNANVAVPAREEESVTVWLRQTGRAMSADHQRRSPLCHPEVLTDLLIPIIGRTRLRGPSIQ